MMKRVMGTTAMIVGLLAGAGASAHTVTFGYLPGSGTGAVTFWMGSYHSPSENGNNNEGAMDLVGINSTSFGPASYSFNLVSSSLPSGLTPGDNYFCDSSYGTFGGGGCDAGAGVYFWQGVTVTGLSPGDYSFSFTNPAGTTQVFAPWSQNLGASFTLDAGDIGGGDGPSPVPLPAGAGLLLAGLGAIGFAARRRRKS